MNTFVIVVISALVLLVLIGLYVYLGREDDDYYEDDEGPFVDPTLNVDLIISDLRAREAARGNIYDSQGNVIFGHQDDTRDVDCDCEDCHCAEE